MILHVMLNFYKVFHQWILALYYQKQLHYEEIPDPYAVQCKISEEKFMKLILYCLGDKIEYFSGTSNPDIIKIHKTLLININIYYIQHMTQKQCDLIFIHLLLSYYFFKQFMYYYY